MLYGRAELAKWQRKNILCIPNITPKQSHKESIAGRASGFVWLQGISMAKVEIEAENTI